MRMLTRPRGKQADQGGKTSSFGAREVRISIPGSAAESRLPAGPMPFLCWVLISAIHYHDARLHAMAKRGCFRLGMIQLTDTDTFAALQPNSPSPSYACYTLFRGVCWSSVDPRTLVNRMHEQLNALRPSVICINGWSSGGCISSLIWCLRNRVPAILMSDSAEHDEPRRWWKEAIKGRIVRLCSAALVAGATHRAYLAKLGFPHERIFDGYDVVDNKHFERGAAAARRAEPQLRAELNLPAQYFLACSRFEAKKNLGRMLEAYATYRKKSGARGWSLVVLGDGSLRGELEDLRGRLGLDGLVLFPGFKRYEQLPIYYGLAEAFLHVSTVEQWGLVVNEAMAAELPVVVSRRCGCAAELVSQGVNGFAVDPYDVAEIADAMYQIAADSCDRQIMGQESRRLIARWSPDRFAQNLTAAAEAGLAAPRPTPDLLDQLIMWLLTRRQN
jgi:glycosyltransferase involved in cell wall biosynthesis